MDHHGWAQDYFNNGTMAWENSDFRQAIADYANASMEYNAAANSYGQMARYAGSPQEKEFGDSLRGCTFNLSLASDSFMNAAIALETERHGESLRPVRGRPVARGQQRRDAEPLHRAHARMDAEHDVRLRSRPRQSAALRPVPWHVSWPRKNR